MIQYPIANKEGKMGRIIGKGYRARGLSGDCSYYDSIPNSQQGRKNGKNNWQGK
jgi:hypothetical protein